MYCSKKCKGGAWRDKQPKKSITYPSKEEQKRRKQASSRAWREKNRERLSLENKRWESKNKEKVKRYGRRAAAHLTDRYVKNTIAGTDRKLYANIPPELIEAKRIQLQIKRLLRERKA